MELADVPHSRNDIGVVLSLNLHDPFVASSRGQEVVVHSSFLMLT